MSEFDLKKYKIRTDLIVESINDKLEGIIKEEKQIGDIKISDIIVENDIDEIGKKKGQYITISFDDITDTSNRKKVEKVVVEYLNKVLKNNDINENSSALVIGLGNIKSTPDSLGPKVSYNIIVTRHLYSINEIKVEEGYRNVSSFAPGVMGNTGIEARDIIFGLVKEIKPDFLIVVDALASSSIERVNKTIQITNTGISPGSGVGNSRSEISKESVGIPVIAVGIPTVVDAVTIVSDTFRYLLKKFSYNIENINNNSDKLKVSSNINYLKKGTKELSKEEKEQLLGFLGGLEEEEIHSLMHEVLTPIGYNMMVTPKEVDFVIEKLQQVLSSSINKALHKAMNIN